MPEKIIQIKEPVGVLNRHRHAYYNLNCPTITDMEYDQLFDKLKNLEAETGIILSNSPTQTVGYYPVSSLKKVEHPIPLLSLDKTKQVSELCSLLARNFALLMLKLDGLTTKLIYEDGKLLQASTRGNGETGEDITHNIPAYQNVPLSIPYKKRLIITGESYIHINDFERLKETLLDSNEKPYRNPRNLAAGSVRNLNPAKCAERCVYFTAFTVTQSDETPTQVIHDDRSPGSKSYMWVHRSDEFFKDCPIVIYEYQKGRNHELPLAFYQDYNGVLVTDGLKQYHLLQDKIPGLTNANCWAHARWDYADTVKAANKADGEAVKRSIAYQALSRIALIYELESTLKDLTPEQRLQERQNSIKPLVEEYFTWVKKQLSDTMVLPKGKLPMD